jgi:hypothetical protein
VHVKRHTKATAEYLVRSFRLREERESEREKEKSKTRPVTHLFVTRSQQSRVAVARTQKAQRECSRHLRQQLWSMASIVLRAGTRRARRTPRPRREVRLGMLQEAVTRVSGVVQQTKVRTVQSKGFRPGQRRRRTAPRAHLPPYGVTSTSSPSMSPCKAPQKV